jgi:two-component system, cell cycle response regulator DivK
MNLSNLSTWRVLVVDDEEDSIEIVEMVLFAVGAIVYRASNGQEGLAVFSQAQPNLVLTDLSMPEVDGWEMLKAIRKLENGTLRTPVIALTAHAMMGDRDRILAAGFDGYLGKPLHMVTLIEDLIIWIDKIA